MLKKSLNIKSLETNTGRKSMYIAFCSNIETHG